MQITKITQQVHDKGRYSVYIDGVFAFGLVAEDIAYFRLKEGNDISEETFTYITTELLYIKAQDTALHYVGYKMRTEAEVRKKLQEKLFPEETIERVIAFLLEYRYIDDEEYCQKYIRERNRCNPKGKYILKMELKQRGISTAIIERALAAAEIDEVGNAVKALEKKHVDLAEIDEKEKQRLLGFLQRRGYSYDIIKEAFQVVLEEQQKEKET